MIVYRVAQPCAQMDYKPMGPYSWTDEDGHYPPETATMTHEHSNDWRNHPSPLTEGHGYMVESEFCGFTDELRLLEWFDGWLDELHSLGFRIYEYKVDPNAVYDYPFQTIFDMECAELFRSYLINPS